ncbi:MAG: DUF899 family protein [Solirubrobacterales bacterium]|nr:DUF899 family protein [Solirubrobacterales bacterium]
MKVGTEQEWQAARRELLAAERELEAHAERVQQQRRALPWVPVEGYPPMGATSCSTTATRSAGRKCRGSFARSSTWGSCSERRRNGCATTATRSGRRTSGPRFR